MRVGLPLNKALDLRLFVRMIQKPELLIEFKDYREITRCNRCNAVVNAYTYLPLLNNIYVCRFCYQGWLNWGMGLFLEMIHYE